LTGKTIRNFHGGDVWRDDDGTVWVRQSQLVEAVGNAQYGLEDVRADLAWISADRERDFNGWLSNHDRNVRAQALDDAADAWIPDEQDGLARWFDFVPDRLRARAARIRSGELKE
jgi:hypothetical protein